MSGGGNDTTTTTNHVGWRRFGGGRYSNWERVDASERPTRGACYDALMTLCELVGGSPSSGRAEYRVLPVGVHPATLPIYRTREMRPPSWRGGTGA